MGPPAFVASPPSSLPLIGSRQWLPVPCGGCPRRPLSRRLRLLSVFSAPGSGSPSPVEVTPAGLCRVASVFSPSSRPQAVAPRPLWRLPPPAFVASPPSSLRLLGPRQWLPVPCGGCPRRPLSRHLRLLSVFSA